MHIHILGIAGTFMAGIARIAKQMGHIVTGSDFNIYPPMSDILKEQNIKIINGYERGSLPKGVELVLVGNVIKRGMPIIEEILEKNINYESAPRWLGTNLLKKKYVIAVAGTHGKTSVSSMITWALYKLGVKSGFLIGGAPHGFKNSSELGDSDLFVIEADEYDTAFFDKRSKFLHYFPNIFLINNIEFDHSDIFSNIAEIKKQFAYGLRLLNKNDLVILDKNSKNSCDVYKQEPHAKIEKINQDLTFKVLANTSEFEVFYKSKFVGVLSWNLFGEYNILNALMALSTLNYAGFDMQDSIKALTNFQAPKKRMQYRFDYKNVAVFEDFAHHPTAIKNAILALKDKYQNKKIIALLHLGSNSMQAGSHLDKTNSALQHADFSCVYSKDINSLNFNKNIKTFTNLEKLIENLNKKITCDFVIVVMSNKNFDGLLDILQSNNI